MPSTEDKASNDISIMLCLLKIPVNDNISISYLPKIAVNDNISISTEDNSQ